MSQAARTEHDERELRESVDEEVHGQDPHHPRRVRVSGRNGAAEDDEISEGEHGARNAPPLLEATPRIGPLPPYDGRGYERGEHVAERDQHRRRALREFENSATPAPSRPRA